MTAMIVGMILVQILCIITQKFIMYKAEKMLRLTVGFMIMLQRYNYLQCDVNVTSMILRKYKQ